MSSSPTIRYTNDNSVFFALTRMNPPTPGHLGLIEILIHKAIEKGINHVYVCLSKTLDKGNPIECEMKKKVLGDDTQPFERITMINSLKRKMIEKTNGQSAEKQIKKMRIILFCVSDEESSPFHTIQNIIRKKIEAINRKNAMDSPEKDEEGRRKRKYNSTDTEELEKINLFMVAGADRVDFIDSVDSYYSKWPQVRTPILREAPPRGGMLSVIDQTKTQEGINTLDIDLITEQQGWSGTMIRNIVVQGGETRQNKPIFHKIYKGMLETFVADELYDAIWDGLKYNKSPKMTKTAKKRPASKKSPMSKKSPNKSKIAKNSINSVKEGGKRYTKKIKKKSSKFMKSKKENAKLKFIY